MRSKVIKYYGISLVFLIFNQVSAQETFHTLDSVLDQYEKTEVFNGVILVAQKGEITFNRSIGFADQEGKSLDLNTPMHLASISKTFTVMAVMILEQRGLLDFEDNVNNYLKNMPYANMTIEHLMTGTSGLKRLYNKATNDYGIISIQSLIDYCSSKKPKLSFTPGDRFQSTVAGYCLLAGIVERVSGKSYSKFLEDEIFEPLKMHNTFLLTEDTWNLPRAISYDRNNKEKEWLLGSYNGGIGIYASALDLLKWDQALYSEKLVSPETMTSSYESMQLNDGSYSHVTLGSWMRWKGKENLIFKNGDWVANNSILFRDIENNITVIIMNNRDNKITKFDIMDIVLPELGYSL